jgi:hypothetical protein
MSGVSFSLIDQTTFAQCTLRLNCEIRGCTGKTEGKTEREDVVQAQNEVCGLSWIVPAIVHAILEFICQVGMCARDSDRLLRHTPQIWICLSWKRQGRSLTNVCASSLKGTRACPRCKKISSQEYSESQKRKLAF